MRMRRNPPIKTRRPFTLVELVAAMAIMIFVALIIGTASAAFYNAWKRSVRVTDMLKVRQNIDRIMDVSIRNMIRSTGPPQLVLCGSPVLTQLTAAFSTWYHIPTVFGCDVRHFSTISGRSSSGIPMRSAPMAIMALTDP